MNSIPGGVGAHMLEKQDPFLARPLATTGKSRYLHAISIKDTSLIVFQA